MRTKRKKNNTYTKLCSYLQKKNCVRNNLRLFLAHQSFQFYDNFKTTFLTLYKALDCSL